MKNILRHFIMTIIISLFLSACVAIPGSTSLEQNAQKVTVLIVTPIGYGTGILVSSDKILTVKHISSIDRLSIYFYEGTSLPTATYKPLIGEIIWLSDNADLALLSIPSVDTAPVDIICQTPEIGTPVFIIGQSGLATRWTVRYGNVASSNINSYGSLILDMNTASGDSGAGVFNYDGKLIGIIVAMQTSKLGYDGFAFMIPGSKICEELADKL